ncbi:hypothetical protein AWC29_00025 [Mycobacterium triplex]|uniref:Membrane protein n=1 Tax=Mycobacterium triplex TaxID=47839 RepID=A0A024K2Z0_9MYCO|nr:TIGR04255 family protein [Mycobacterium triplex]ORX05912.1 hypothetical protein AWC29_00025 [Mycobacterium triplex]CDO89957.1 membrane protein [Mycobacterium triplex]
MYPNREVFPNAPLALVIAEIKFSDSPRLRQQETLDVVAIALEERFPVSTPQTNVTFTVGNLGPGVLPQVVQERRTVLMNSAKTESVTITPASFIYETTSYREFDDLCSGVIAVCEALAGANVRPALVRVGLRYVDEVRVPEPITDVRAWGKWIDASVISTLAIGPDGVPARNAQGLVTFDLSYGKGLTFQYQALDQHPIVQPQLLTRQNFDAGPFFVLDFDGFRDFNGEDVVRLDANEVTTVLNEVHGPVGAAFQRAITEDARNLFRGVTA